MTLAHDGLLTPRAPTPMSEEEFMRMDAVWAEWVDGVAYFMSPITADHGEIGLWMAAVLRMLSDEKNLGRVFAEPFVFRAPGQRRMRSPDVFFIARTNPGRLERSRFVGAPDFIVEVVSEDSLRRDTVTKRDEYESIGVREYLVVNPLNQSATLFRLGADGKFFEVAPVAAPGEPHGRRLVSEVVDGFFFVPEWIAHLPLPSPYRIVREMGL